MSFEKTTPRSNRVHIGIFGRRNVGKSSLINAISEQDVALVSPVPGTTTDPVYRTMEIHGVGPVVLVDTPGIDDEGELGRARVARSLRILRKTDLVLLVLDPLVGVGEPERNLLRDLAKRKIPVIVVMNKSDLVSGSAVSAVHSSPERSPASLHGTGNLDLAQTTRSIRSLLGEDAPQEIARVSALTGDGIPELVREISRVISRNRIDEEPPIVGDLLEPGDLVVLVIPVDMEAPKGRLILPQVQTLRDILDHNAAALCVRIPELGKLLPTLGKQPRLVITDSQVFREADAALPREIPLTSFSILFARHKGEFAELIRGVRSLDRLKPYDRVLIAEACTHHPIEDDIARVKIPRWLQQKVGGTLDFTWSRGVSFPDNLDQFKVIVHCGGCMLNRKEMASRIDLAKEAGVPITNYGMTIAWANGILERALEPFGI